MDREDHELISFRQEWQRELESSSCRGSHETTPKHQSPRLTHQENENYSENCGEIKTDVELKAAEFFNHGVQLEESGQLYESIKYYKRAISLVPDIEFRVHRRYIQEREANAANQATNSDGDNGKLAHDDEIDLASRFENLMGLNTPFCQPQFTQEATHISCLPPEMLDQILLWVIGDQLDFNAIERMSVVCRGLYIACRNPEIWKRACNRVWSTREEDIGSYGSWRQMYITRPRPKFNGCYISRTTYFRCGESGFQDSSYQAYHVVSYYRYMRFFPDGLVLTFVSAEEPQHVVGHLKNREPLQIQVMKGQYRIHDSSLTMIFVHKSPKLQQFRNRNKEVGTTDVKETKYQMEFEIKSPRGRSNFQLQWQYYSISSCAFNGKANTSVLDVSNQDSFPHIYFSRVKRFDALSERPL